MSSTHRTGPVPVTVRTMTPYTHYTQLKDAVTKGNVTNSTKLATMYTGQQHAVHDDMLGSLTEIASRGARCGLKKGLGGTNYPETDVKGAHGYDLHITFNRLVSPTLLCSRFHADGTVDVRTMRTTRVQICGQRRVTRRAIPHHCPRVSLRRVQRYISSELQCTKHACV